MANNNNALGVIKLIGAILSIVVIIAGAVLVFSAKADKTEVVACQLALEKQVKDGDVILHTRINKTEEKIDKLGDELKELIKDNQEEIIEILKRQ